MRFLTDAHISLDMIDVLATRGHDVLDARTLPPRTTDDELIRIAERDGSVIITNDRDFGTLVFASRMHVPGVVLIRMPTDVKSIG
jgi:predicted nuclease of predicted toxin-antitoxin system